MTEVYVVGALRTAIGNFNGSLSSLAAHKLGALVIKELMSTSGLSSEEISEVILGQVLTAAQGQNPARQASIYADLSVTIPAFTINKVCGSGLKAVILGTQAIKSGDASIIIAGGQENMSLAPHASILRSGVKMGDTKLVDTMILDGLWDVFNNYHMGITAENIAKKYNITRETQDQFAFDSQKKAEAAQKSGKFKDEIISVKLPSKKEEIIFDQDEFIRHGTTLEALSRLRPAFDKEGTVTAGNASGINDGAAALLLMSKEKMLEKKLTPLAKIVSYASAGVDPKIMGTGPIYAVRAALQKANWTIDDLDLIEANEAFAAQAIAVNNELGWDISKVNVNGGAIALGHPIGASGSRVAVTLLHEMRRRNAKKGIATLCIGGGMGVAVCFERV